MPRPTSPASSPTTDTPGSARPCTSTIRPTSSSSPSRRATLQASPVDDARRGYPGRDLEHGHVRSARPGPHPDGGHGRAVLLGPEEPLAVRPAPPVSSCGTPGGRAHGDPGPGSRNGNRAVPDRVPHRGGRDGRRLPRPRPAARPPGGAEAALSGARRRRALPRPLRARVTAGRLDRPRRDRAGLRGRRRRRRDLHRDALRRGQRPRTAAARRGAARARAGARPRRTARRRARRGARARAGPPRREAQQRAGGARGARLPRRLRPDEDERPGPGDGHGDGERAGGRHRRLHGAGGDPRRGADAGLGPVRAGLRAVRVPDRGRCPYPGPNAATVIYGHLEQPPPRVPELPALDPVLARALAKAPAKRFGSGAELVAAARAALGSGAPPPAHRQAGRRGGRRGRRRRRGPPRSCCGRTATPASRPSRRTPPP